MNVALWPNYRLFPYEEELAIAEVSALAGTEPKRTARGLSFTGDAKRLIERSTYFSAIETESGQPAPTAQAITESLHFDVRESSKNRQATRFLSHGLHEYKGKFNPQMARALINIADPSATSLLDPFCGSGTALIEGARLDLAVSGVDRNPIAVFMANVKMAALTYPHPEKLLSDFERLAESVFTALKRGQDEPIRYRPTFLSADAHNYLEHWFTPPTLSALYSAHKVIDENRESLCAQLILLALSAVLRGVSLQVPEDLRIRRQPAGFVAPSVADRFVSQADLVSKSLRELVRRGTVSAKVLISAGSADDRDLLDRSWAFGRRLIVTSPPYATALPYIDTDRLSIILLGLASPKEIRTLEQDLFGSREWNKSQSRLWHEAMLRNDNSLPEPVTELLSRIAARNTAEGAGFRRAAVPGLLYRYFSAMRRSFEAWASLQRPGERAVLIVGRNRTGPPEDRQIIDTPQLLTAVAGSAGYSLVVRRPFETWPRYGLHADNAVRGEDAIVLERT
jgi:site-specific DNA-methyltransferase (cytosine-N4-specific)